MLTIRAAQLDALRTVIMPALVARTVRYLRTHHGPATGLLPDHALEAAVARSLARARGHGLTWESSLVCFAALALEIGPDFDEHPRIRAALTDPVLPPDDRFAAMLEVATEADWQDARAIGVAHPTDPFQLIPLHHAAGPALAGLVEDLGSAAPLPPDEVARWVARSVEARAVGRDFAFAITAAGGAVIGVAALAGAGSARGTAELSYWIGRSHQGRGHATAAARRVVSFGFARLRLAAIEASVAPDNPASHRVLDKLGAVRIASRDPGAAAAVTYRLRKDHWRATPD
jgi:RimJ/RimL family protein N-acetyltransferase